MSLPPKVARLVMFKHGVAYVERGGATDGPFELAFRREEMSDVLKSLAVWVAKGDARVGALSFDAPDDPEKSLAGRRLLFDAGHALQGFVQALRGRAITVRDDGREVTGEVLGFQRSPAGPGAVREVLLLRTASGQISTFDLSTLKHLELQDDTARGDLAFFVDRSRAATAEDHRVVRVDLSAPAEDVRASYVIPAPVWRVSYRLVLDGDEALVMGWGIVHNPTQEELRDIELTLTTGEPVSFAIDLYNPKRVERTVVEERVRRAAPQRLERATARPKAMMMMAAAPMAMAEEAADDSLENAPTAHIAAGLPLVDAAAGADRGELFEYRVLGKISLKRDGSAMVPLLSTRIRGQKERIYRVGPPGHPSLVLSFSNETGAVLEEGPAVLYDEGVYSGEAMMPFTARGVDVKLAYANDLGVRCRHGSRGAVVATGVRLDDELLVEEQRREERHVVFAESDHATNVDLIVELPKTFGRTLSPEAAQPFEETASFYRFKCTVPARGRVELGIVERWPDARHVRYSQLQPGELERWLEGKFLDKATFEALAEVLSALNRAKGLDAQRARVEQGREDAQTKQKKIADQLSVLKETGPEGALRLRYVKELEREQDKVNACDAEIARLRDEADTARTDAARKLEQLVKKPAEPAAGSDAAS